jgi:hypothetical protein
MNGHYPKLTDDDASFLEKVRRMDTEAAVVKENVYPWLPRGWRGTCEFVSVDRVATIECDNLAVTTLGTSRFCEEHAVSLTIEIEDRLTEGGKEAQS